MNMKERNTDLWLAWPALRRALPFCGSAQSFNTIESSTSSSPVFVQPATYDKPCPWRYVRWQKGNERQAQTWVGRKENRPKGNYVYKVIPGESLSDIASNHDTYSEAIMESNKILNPANVATGQLLWIPRTHYIQRGNTLWSLSRRYGVSIPNIQAANGIEDPDLIYAGDILVIPNV